MKTDFAPILVPFEKNTAGQDLKYEPMYDQIKNARTEDDSSLSMGVWERELKKSDWSEVENLSFECLEKKSKDLQIACWLCESWIRLYDFEGFINSFDFINKFCLAFWEFFYPQTDIQNTTPENDSGFEHRIRILEWLLEMMTSRIVFVPISMPIGIINQSLTLSDWFTAQNIDSISRRTGEQISENDGRLTLQKFRNIIKQAPIEQLSYVMQKVSILSAKSFDLEKTLSEKCFGQEPIFTKFREHLTDIERLCEFAIDGRKIKKENTQKNHEENENPRKNDLATIENNSATQDLDLQLNNTDINNESNNKQEEENVTITSRDDAYKAINDLAEFLIELEPQSTPPYLAKLVASWANKSLPQIIEDIQTGSTDSHKILKMLAEVAKKN